MFKKIKQQIENWLRLIIWEETQRASTHFKQLTPDRADQIVRLMLDLHDKNWSLESDNFLRELNINPEKYWKKYRGVKK